MDHLEQVAAKQAGLNYSFTKKVNPTCVVEKVGKGTTKRDQPSGFAILTKEQREKSNKRGRKTAAPEVAKRQAEIRKRDGQMSPARDAMRKARIEQRERRYQRFKQLAMDGKSLDDISAITLQSKKSLEGENYRIRLAKELGDTIWNLNVYGPVTKQRHLLRLGKSVR